MASNLYKSIIAECDIAQAQLAGIERTVAESEKRCEALEDMVTWDGEQPDFWYISGSSWKRATAAHVGKLVRVNNRASCKPTESPEAKLIGIAHGWICCEGSKGQIVEWKYAWIEADPDEDTERPEDETKGYISIQVGSFYPGEPSVPVVKQSLTTEYAPTVNESLTVEPRFKIGDRVRIRKPENPSNEASYVWFKEMDQYDGRECLIKCFDPSHPAGVFYEVDTIKEWRFLEQFLEPVLHQVAIDPPFKAGDFVRIAKPKETERSFKAWFPSMEGFDGAVRRVSKCNTENRNCTLETCGGYVFPFSWLTKIEV
jgi:hypothetical protein